MVIMLFISYIALLQKKTSIHSPHIFGQSSPGSQVWPLPCTSSVKRRPGFEPVDLQLKNLGFKQQSHGICGGNNGTQWNLNQ